VADSVPVHPGLWEEGRDGPRLVGGRCDDCGRPHFPRATTCPWCSGESIADTRLAPEGTLWGWTAVTAPPPGYLGDVPFGFGVVELPDGIRVVTRLTEADPLALRFGQPMRLTIVALGPRDDDVVVDTWAFAPVEGTS
jgi:uncharacterized OB-fold protein